MIDVETNVNFALVKKYDLIHLIQLIVDYHIRKFLSGLQILQELQHENLVGVVIPRIKGGLIEAVVVRKLEYFLESGQKILEDKSNKDLLLDVPR